MWKDVAADKGDDFGAALFQRPLGNHKPFVSGRFEPLPEPGNTRLGEYPGFAGQRCATKHKRDFSA